jgi:hypothetical protein
LLHNGTPSLRRRGSSLRANRIRIWVRQRRTGEFAAEAGTADLKPERRPIPQHFPGRFIVPTKVAPFAGNIHRESGALPQPWCWAGRWSVSGCWLGCKIEYAHYLGEK